MEQYGYFIATTVIGLMIGALGWFLQRMVKEIDQKLDRSDNANKDRFDSLEKRVNKQEERFDQMIKDLPKTYAYRDDLLRMMQAIEGRLDKQQDLLMDIKRGGA